MLKYVLAFLFMLPLVMEAADQKPLVINPTTGRTEQLQAGNNLLTSDSQVIVRNTDNTASAVAQVLLERGSGVGNDAQIRTTGDTANGVASLAVRLQGADYLTMTGTGNTFLYPVIAPAATTSITSIRMPHGTAPSSPTNGDMWTTTSGVFARVNGSTVGPFVDSTSGAVQAFWAKASSATPISITGATTATLNRIHQITGTTADYDITISGLSPSTGDILGFQVKKWSLANRQYRLDAGGSVDIAGRTRYLTLLHTNVVLLQWDGTDWIPLVLNLDTPWIVGNAAGTTTIQVTATSVNPTKGTTASDFVRWRRVAGSQEIVYYYDQTAAGGAANGTGDYLYAIPIGTINTTMQPAITAANSDSVRARFNAGWGQYNWQSDSRDRVGLGVYDTTKLRMCFDISIQGSTATGYNSTSMQFMLFANLPMTDW